jgi:hypothetical protein
MATNLGKPVRLRNDSGAQLELDSGGTTTALTGSGGNLGIGTTSPGQIIHGKATNPFLQLERAVGANVYVGSDSTGMYIGSDGNIPIYFTTNNAERARITAAGYLKASNDGTYSNATGLFHEISQDAVGSGALILRHTSSSANANSRAGLAVSFPNFAENSGSFSPFIICSDSAATRFRVNSNGDALNSTGTYGTISDEKVKQDIEDAGSAWEDLKAVRFRKYRLKANVEANPDAPSMLGVVAQELEQVMPGLVSESPDRDEEGNDLGTKTKAVKTSVLLLKAAVALQEAMTRIESLETRLAALESGK